MRQFFEFHVALLQNFDHDRVKTARGIGFDDVTAAVRLLRGGSLAAQFEDEDQVSDYWEAVEETRRRLGDVLVAEENGESHTK